MSTAIKMRLAFRTPLIAAILLASTSIFADDKPDVGPNYAGQSAADALRAFAGSDGAFIAGGMLKDTFNKDDLSTMLAFPTDGIEVLSLTGDQIRQAFERSVSMYPAQNKSFLQISGFDVVYKKAAGPTRIVSISVNGAPLDNNKSYTVAMPWPLAHGAVGYFRVWNSDKPVKTFPQSTMESVLKGKKSTEGSLRWSAQG